MDKDVIVSKLKLNHRYFITCGEEQYEGVYKGIQNDELLFTNNSPYLFNILIYEVTIIQEQSTQSTSLLQVTEFHEVFGHDIEKSIPNTKKAIAIFRVRMILEELGEIMSALSLCGDFVDLLEEEIKNTVVAGNKELNYQQEVTALLDGLVDIDYFHKGWILEAGLQDIYDEAFKTVHQNNMTKCHTTYADAEKTLKHHEKVVGELYIDSISDKEVFIVKRVNDGKVLKPLNYQSVKLDNIVTYLIKRKA